MCTSSFKSLFRFFSDFFFPKSRGLPPEEMNHLFQEPEHGNFGPYCAPPDFPKHEEHTIYILRRLAPRITQNDLWSMSGEKWVGAAVGARTEDSCPDLVGDAVILDLRIASPSMPGSQFQPPELLQYLFELLQGCFKDRIQIIEATVPISRNLIKGKVVTFQCIYAKRHT
jgi:hypothetical protein